MTHTPDELRTIAEALDNATLRYGHETADDAKVRRNKAIKEARVAILAMLDRVAALETRLEVVPGWSESVDGISCRDDTIALLDARILAMLDERAALEAGRVVDDRPDLGSSECKIMTYNEFHELAVEMGYPSMTEAFEELSELRAERAADKARIADLDRAGKEIVVALHSFVMAGCPVCSGDCASANPPVQGCPMREANRVVCNWNAARAKGE